MNCGGIVAPTAPSLFLGGAERFPQKLIITTDGQVLIDQKTVMVSLDGQPFFNHKGFYLSPDGMFLINLNRNKPVFMIIN